MFQIRNSLGRFPETGRWLALGLGGWLAAAGCAADPGEAALELAASSEPYLFVDDVWVERMEGVWRVLNRPRKVPENPVIEPDRPWEGYLILQPGTVIYDEEDRLFKMWYNTFATRQRPYVEEYLCYAVSRDGIHWEKPELGLVEFQGSTANNIMLKWSAWTHSLIKDEGDPDPARRYKLAYWHTQDRARSGVWVAFSADGVRWNDYPDNPVVPSWATGDTFSVMRDPDSSQYWLYHKTTRGPVRRVSRLVSDDFIHWADSRQVLEPDEWDQPDTEFYGLSAFPYGGQYLGLLWVYHTYTQFMDVQLASSRDGVSWERSVNRRRFIHLLPDGNYTGDTFDSGMIYPASAPVVKDDQLWIYYSGFTVVHNAPSEDHDGQIGLVTLRKDAFVSLDATSEGYVVTPPVRFEGSSLRVNSEPLGGGGEGEALHSRLFTNNPEARGYVRIEIQDARGRPIPGYEADSCEPLRGDALYEEVSWNGNASLEALRGRTVRLKFVLSYARLHSFQVQ